MINNHDVKVTKWWKENFVYNQLMEMFESQGAKDAVNEFITKIDKQSRLKALNEAVEVVKNEISYSVAEDPSVYPSNEGQDAVYGVNARLERCIVEALEDLKNK